MRGLRAVAVSAVVRGTDASLLGCFTVSFLPLASFTRNPSSGQAPLEVRFDATLSADADGTIARYDWPFGDGREASGPEMTHVYGSPGLYEAVLVVTDDRGASASQARIVDVTDSQGGPPVGREIGKRRRSRCWISMGTGFLSSASGQARVPPAGPRLPGLRSCGRNTPAKASSCLGSALTATSRGRAPSWRRVAARCSLCGARLPPRRG